MHLNERSHDWLKGKTVLRVVTNTELFGQRILFGVFAGRNPLGAIGLDCTEEFLWINPAYIERAEALSPREIACMFRQAHVLIKIVGE